MIEHLEFIPEAGCLRLDAYRLEILQVKDNTVRSVRVLPPAGQRPVCPAPV